jgi:hypothetical protein
MVGDAQDRVSICHPTASVRWMPARRRISALSVAALDLLAQMPAIRRLKAWGWNGLIRNPV